MRIVFDDKNLPAFVASLEFIMRHIYSPDVCEYSCGTNRVSLCKLAEVIRYNIPAHFIIGKVCEHAYGIGNNNKHPIYFYASGSEEMVLVGYINLNIDPFGAAYVNVEDLFGNLSSKRFTITSRGIKITT